MRSPASRILLPCCLLLACVGGSAAADKPAAPAALPSAPPFPAVDDLPVLPGLPDPLVFNDGTPVKTPEQWRRRREQIKALFEQYVYGHVPPPPGEVEGEEISSEPILDGTAVHRIVRLRFGPGGKGEKGEPGDKEKKLTIRLSLIVPGTATANDRKPVVLYLFRGNALPENGLWPDYDLIVKRGYVAACMANADAAPDRAGRDAGFLPAYPEDDWGDLICWAWGMQRCVDWLAKQDFVAADKIAVSGHSRRGKACLLAAAFDERIALAAPSGSGCGGVGLSRAAEHTEKAETVKAITTHFPYWFGPQFPKFADKVDRLPVDQHMLIALVAPRAVMNNDGLADLWANPPGEQEAMLAALPVWRLLGAGGLGEKVGLHFRPGGHDITRDDWSAILDFCDKVLLGKKVERKFDQLAFPAQ